MSYKYSVALCTYNGEKFLREQLESILAQTISPDEIIVCDDASTDKTIMVLHEFAKKHGSIKICENNPALGVRKNFERALNTCSGELIFLSDQDDIWVSNKIETVIKYITDNKIDIHQPLMFFSDLEVVNEKLKTISPSLWNLSRFNIPDDPRDQLATLMVQNFVTGAGAIVSKKLIEIAYPFPDNITMHDHWLALVAVNFGKLFKIDKPLVKYRQHSYNVVGATTPNLFRFIVRSLSGKISFFTESKDFWSKRKQIESVIRLAREMSPQHRQLLEEARIALKTGGLKSIQFVSQNKVFPMQTDLKILFYIYLFILPIMSKQGE